MGNVRQTYCVPARVFSLFLIIQCDLNLMLLFSQKQHTYETVLNFSIARLTKAFRKHRVSTQAEKKNIGHWVKQLVISETVRYNWFYKRSKSVSWTIDLFPASTDCRVLCRHRCRSRHLVWIRCNIANILVLCMFYFFLSLPHFRCAIDWSK